MSPLNFFHLVLKALEDGKVNRKAIALALQIAAVFRGTPSLNEDA